VLNPSAAAKSICMMLKDIFLLASWKRGKKKILSSTKTQGDLG
jgi:hypothetical protein